MADDEEKKQKKRDFGATIGNIVQIIKYLKNPIIMYIAIALLIIILIIGFVGFFISMPGNLAGWVSEKLMTWWNGDYINVTDEEIVELCKQLEEMGIDLEQYGFVEKIERGESTQTSKGEITSVKSKYLKEYLVAERKSYIIANKNKTLSKRETNTYVFERECRRRAVEKTFDEIGNEVFKDAILELYDYDESTGEYILKDNNEKYKLYATIKEEDLPEKIKFMLTTYYYERKISLNVNSLLMYFAERNALRKMPAYSLGKSLVGKLSRDDKKRFEERIDTNENDYREELKEYSDSGEGLIFLEKDTSDEQSKWEKEENGAKTKYTIEINKEQRYFIVKSANNTGWWNEFLNALNLSTKKAYAYDLNNWTSKYGKPVEFLISLHLATGAPDFVYKIATSPIVDTKVHVDLFPVQTNIKFVTAEEGGQTISALLEETGKNQEILNKYKDYVSALKEGLDYPNVGIEDKDALEKLGTVETIRDFYYIFMGILSRNHAPGSTSEKFRKTCDSVLDNKHIKITLNGKDYEFSFRDMFFGDDSIEKKLDEYQKPMPTATPYITKVVNHWYRNQYFTGIDEIDFADKKTRLRKLINNVYTYFITTHLGPNGEQVIDENEEYKNKKKDALNEIDEKDTDEKIKEYLEKQEEIWTAIADSEEKKQKIKNEFTAVKKEFAGEITGTAYKVDANLEPIYYQAAEAEGYKFSGNEVVDKFFHDLYIEETRSADLVQEHNPLFEDNSQYIRNWLKEKYYIYQTNERQAQAEVESEIGENTTSNNTTASAIIPNGRQYIQGKKALEAINKMIEDSTDREGIVYMLRDVKELFQDFEFDLENVDSVEAEVLDNIMPAYKPYTSWPSVYEKAETNCTKMIYKTTGSSNIVAPANGIITKAEDNIIEIQFTPEAGQAGITTGMILHVEAEQGSISDMKEIGAEVERGKIIAKANASGGMIILKLRLFSPTKQILKVESYMTVERKEYEDLEENEKKCLYNLQKTEIEEANKETLQKTSQRTALMNVIFNKIASPFYPQINSVSSILGSDESAKSANFLRYAAKEKSTSLKDLEKDKNAKYAILNALSGVDVTKENTWFGATSYFAIDDKYYEDLNISAEDKEKILQAEKDLAIRVEIGNRTFGITEEEYLSYLGDVIGKKIDEVIYALDLEKYVSGLEEYNGQYGDEYYQKRYQELLKIFEPAKNEVIQYYVDGTFLEECTTTPLNEGMKTVTNIIKSNLSQEIEDLGDGSQKVIDKFTLTANSNFSTKWTFTYIKGAEGKIEIEPGIKVKREPIIGF